MIITYEGSGQFRTKTCKTFLGFGNWNFLLNKAVNSKMAGVAIMLY